LDHPCGDPCDDHLFIPDLIGQEPIDAGNNWIKYDTWTNGRESTRSADYERA
jgi:hypothetical protein